MKLVSYTHNGEESFGAVIGENVVDLRGPSSCGNLAEFVGSNAFANREELIRGIDSTPLNQVTLLPPIPRPEKIVCAVRNYMDHHKEVLAAGMQRELTEYPPIFLRVWRSQSAHGQPIVRPRASESLDWEGELAVIIGKEGRDIAEDDAWDHVAGYSCYNDASVREWQFHAKQIAAGKNFENTGGFGPWLVTADEVVPGQTLKITTRLNDEVVQSGDTSHLIFSVPQLINYASTIFTLVPGDVIVTGTPAGVGWSRKPQRFMKPGDTVEVEIESIGILKNPVTAQG
ncbi:fumarylacetoacetate hydrolase family protein [Arthrobacter crystallopoietes]|uniref:fumarylacetoacetate hydrolase family protein n=1 Tax=Crystallibacter crystallopoietes TaxID=37928 RepID=UPI00244CA5E1|nr:fumarylacetoacetate hydrolase family protein [Arthrobacter crystallopoietes]